MAWNPQDPNSKDPWGRDKNNKPQGAPPDIDALLQQFKSKLLAALGSRKQNGEGGSANPVNHLGAILICAALFVLWVLSGIFIVAPAERGVVLRFGRYVDTVGPGPHWIPPLFESKQVVDVQRVSNFTYESYMLTKDENIVSVSVAVQYRIQNAQAYLFNVVDPDTSLEQATASALRQVVGHNTLDDLLTTGRQQVREQVALQLQQLIESYKTGLIITDVTLQPVNPPEEVTAAFDDAIKAREDQQSYINKAEAYAKQVSAAAGGKSARILQEADGYKKQVVLEAQTNTANYLALLPEYQKSPETMRQRLYLNAMQTVLSTTSKLFLDQKSGNMVYLPLDKMSIMPAKIDNPSVAVATKPAAPVADNSPDLTAPFMGRASYPARGDDR